MKHLVLLGGGHAHVAVLKSFAALALGNNSAPRITLISPYARQIYSGMLPGWVAGHYDVNDCTIALPPLVTAANGRFLQAYAVGLDHATQTVICRNGDRDERVSYDFLSIDTGSVANTATIKGAEKLIAIRPIEDFVIAIGELKEKVFARHRASQKTNIVVVGAGAGGLEIAFALQHALVKYGASVSIVSAANTLADNVASRISAALKRADITRYENSIAGAIEADHIQLTNGATIAADVAIAALGAKPAQWPKQSGLACDKAGYIETLNTLQSISHPNIFAAGDIASIVNEPRPKSGVYAVRAGPPLANNLRRALNNETLQAYVPQTRAMYLISTGDKHAIGAWGNFAWQGRWVWRWKNKIDHAFINKYR